MHEGVVVRYILYLKYIIIIYIAYMHIASIHTALLVMCHKYNSCDYSYIR